ncbi:granule associated Rac and RHOG effector protein 1 isoform X2 [Perognathus longimembris pacificus]|uniref:granule associated Rac and RHOG effector protein 1 isoform X2 n=1 Tax=Perognathus longimembris pacificus TaxID=214514 RepID=UPI002019A978|nr:granule associated Rac and RHOG effector protein 1 isoform X2 [Perognathus longimembris pacificus]
MYCCSAQDSKMDHKRRFLLGGSKQKVQQHQQYPLPELGRALSAPLASTATAAPLGSLTAAGSCHHAMPHSTPIADIQQGISKYLDALNVFCRASTFLTDLFSTVFRNSPYSKAAVQLRDVQEHVMEAASRLTSAIKPEIAKMLMELSAGAANFTDQKEFSLQDIEVLGRCFLTVVQVHFQFLTHALQKVQPVAHSCFAEVVVPEKKNSSSGSSLSGMGHTPELEEAVRSWRGAAEATSRLRERGCDGRLAGIEVQQLFCSQSAAIPEHQLKELNVKIDSALQAYKIALESLGHCEYAMKAGFHLNPKAIEASLQGCCSEVEAQQTGRRQTPPQPMQCELPTVPVQIGPHFLKGVSFNESAADNLKLKTVVVDTAQIENKEAYAPQISLEGSRIVVQVPSTWCLKEDPATMSLLQRSLDPEKTLGLVDVLYTAVLDLNRWRAGREQALPCIQIQLQREVCDFGNPADLPSGNGTKSSGGLQKTFSKLTSRFTKKASCSGSSSGTNYSIPSTPSKNIFIAGCSEEKAKMPGNIDTRLQSILNIGSFPRTPDPSQSAQNSSNPMANGFLLERRENLLPGEDGKDEKGMNLPSDQEMQEVIDFLSGFNMGQSHQGSPLVTRRNSAATALVTEQKAGVLQPQQPSLPVPPPPRPPQAGAHPPLTSQPSLVPQQQSPKQQPPQVQYYQHLLQPIGPQQPPPQPRAPGKWVHGSSQQPTQPVGAGLSPLGQWPGISDLSSDLYSLGLVSSYMDNVMSEVLGQKPQGPRNNTWPNRDQSDGVFGMLGEILPFDPAVGSDPEFARYVAGVSQAMQQKRHSQHGRRPGHTRGNWPPMEDAHRTWPLPEFFTEGDGLHSGWSGAQGDSASSSDETSSANGDSLFSMFSGPDLVAAVKQRRKHSSGEQDTSMLPSPPLLPTVEDMNQENKTKTWPPKAPWQHPSPLPSTLPSHGTPLYAVASPGSQWNDTMQMLQSPVWAATSDCSATSFTYVQTPPPQPPAPTPPAHKAAPKAFKAFPGKAERRPAYLPQY